MGQLCVLGLPRGGIPVAWEIAQKLSCPLDMLFVKKIGVPGQPELALGAISEGNQVHWKKDIVDELNISPAELRRLTLASHDDLRLQLMKWREGRAALDVSGKNVIVADDGLATGATMAVALEFLRKRNPKRIIAAIPVASESAIAVIRGLCDDMVVLKTPEFFFAVGQWYRDFEQVSDQDVERLLSLAPSHYDPSSVRP